MTTNVFSISVALPLCAFHADVSRASMLDAIEAVEEVMDDCDVADDNEKRIASSVNSAIARAEEFVLGEINRDEAVMDITYSFLYAYSRMFGVEAMLSGYGLSITVDDDGIEMDLCEDADAFELCVEDMRDIMDQAGMVAVDATIGGVTIH